jgi:hypothetical protein
VLVKLTVMESTEKKKLENPGGDEVLDKLGGKGAGLPFFAFVDAKGELIVNAKRPVEGKEGGANIGHPFAPEEVDWFMTMLKKAAPKIAEKETSTIHEWLKNQKK